MEENRKKRNTPKKTGIYLELECLRQEYLNQFDRSNKIDNKVYITITFLGFLFVFITGIFSQVSTLDIQLNIAHIPHIIYLVCCLLVLITYLYNLVFFMRLLKPEQIRRIDPEYLHQLNLMKTGEVTACNKLIVLFRETIEENLEKLHHRCNRFSNGLRYVIFNVILAFAAYGMGIMMQVH